MPTSKTPQKKSLVKSAQPSELVPLHAIRTETVLSRLPIHNLSKKGTVRIHINKKKENGELDLYWKVSPNADYGEPRQLAYKLDTLIINKRLDELGRPLPKIIRLDSLKKICEELGVVSGGSGNVSIKNAFLQNAFTAITAKLQYKTKDGTEKLLEAGFTRYSVIFTGERMPNGKTADAIFLILNDPYWEVLNNAPTRPLDYDYLKALPPAAQRFYEIVSFKIFAAIKFKHTHAKLTYSEYCTYSAQQRYDDYNHVKKQMYKVHRPHLDSGYITSVHFTKSVDEDGNADWIMAYEPGAKARAGYDLFSKKQQPKTAQTLPAEDSPETGAVALVRSFYQRFHNRDEVSPNGKELEQAKTVIEQHGIEKARFVIAYSFEKAQETRYSPQRFGGILQYVDPAVQAFTAQEQKRSQHNLKSQEHDLKERYERYRTQEIEKMRAALDDETLAGMEAAIREELVSDGTFPAMIGMGVSIRIDAQLEERAGVLPYEEWREGQG